MRKTIGSILIVAILIVAVCLTVAACDMVMIPSTTSQQMYDIDIETVYAMAQAEGYEGTLEDLIAAFKGDSAYALAKAAGYEGTEEEWLLTLRGEDGTTPTIGENGHWFLGETDTGVVAKGEDGAPGNGIESIEKIDSEGLVDTYEITFTDGTSTTFTVTNGQNGTVGQNGITPSIGENGHWYLGDADTGVVAKGEDGVNGTNGAKGDIGVGIEKVEKIKTEGLVDTYTITLTNGDTYDFIVTNGKDGELPHATVSDPTPDEYFNFQLLSDDTYAITSARYQAPSKLYLPSVYNGKAVTKIGVSAFSDSLSVNEVIIPSSIKTIAALAFQGCLNLKKVTFAAGSMLTTLESETTTFKNCPIEEATIPAIADVTVANPSLKKVVYISGESTTEKAFKGFTSLTSVTLNSSLKSIAAETFSGCTGLRSINLRNGLTDIGAQAFQGCDGLQSVSIPDSVLTMGESAFRSCKNLQTVRLPSRLDVIPDSIFQYCYKMRSVTMPVACSSIGEWAFYSCRDMVSITVPAGTVSIGRGAFSDCLRLVEIYNLSELSFIRGSYSNGGIASYALDIYSTLEEDSKLSVTSDKFVVRTDGDEKKLIAYYGIYPGLYTPRDVTEINRNAFMESDELTSIVITGNVKTIGTTAFVGCQKLADVMIQNGVETIGAQAFGNCVELSSVAIPASTTNIVCTAFSHCEGLKSIIVAENNPVYRSEGNCIFVRESNEVLLGCSASVIPWGSTRIGNASFRYCLGLHSVSLPDTVLSIGDSAFIECYDLATVDLGNSMIQIGSEAFRFCKSLYSITIPKSVTGIGEGAFSDCYNLTDIYYEGTRAEWNSLITIDAGGGIAETVTIHYADDEDGWYVEPSEEPTPDEYFRFTLLSDDTYSIKARYHDMPSRTVIPSVYNGKAVTVIEEYAFDGRDTIDELFIPASIKSVKNYAFRGCTGLISVTFAPNTQMTHAGVSVFDGCTSLETATIPSVLCHSVGETQVKTVVVNSGKVILSKAFYGCSSLASITFPDTLTDIYSNAFLACSGLTSVTLPDGLKKIWEGAFRACDHLESIEIPNTVTSIGEDAFDYCIKLRTVTLPSGLKTIPAEAFHRCRSLYHIDLPASLLTIGESAFRECWNLYSITIPSLVTTIEDSAFLGCYKLVEVRNLSALAVTAGGVENGKVGYYAENVYSDPNDSKILVSDTGFVVYRYAADRLSLLSYIGRERDVVVPSGINELHAYAFYKNWDLRTVELPNTLTIIGDNAFHNCSNMLSVFIPGGVTSIGENAFTMCTQLWYVANQSQLVFTLGSTDYGSVALYAKAIGLNKLILMSDCAVYLSNDMTRLTLMRYFGTGTDAKVISGITDIGGNAFKGCSEINDIMLPASITHIADGAFTECTSLKHIIYSGSKTQWNNNVVIENDGGIDESVMIIYGR